MLFTKKFSNKHKFCENRLSKIILYFWVKIKLSSILLYFCPILMEFGTDWVRLSYWEIVGPMKIDAVKDFVYRAT
jgi:hypothetical protein